MPYNTNSTFLCLSRHLFITVTLDQSTYGSVSSAWDKISTLSNRYIEKLDRHFQSLGLYDKSTKSVLQYVRALEEHKNGYPHIHYLLQFPFACIRYSENINPNKKYYFIHNIDYNSTKAVWSHGVCDIQVPYNNQIALKYVLKYITKGTSAMKILWKNINKSDPNYQEVKKSWDGVPSVHVSSKIHGKRALVVSRGFDYSVFHSKGVKLVDDKQYSFDSKTGAILSGMDRLQKQKDSIKRQVQYSTDRLLDGYHGKKV